MQAPIVLLGMHRSGTSMLAKLLDDFGLFTGNQKDENDEAVFFKQINDWLLTQCGGRWDMPHAINHLWRNKNILDWNECYVRYLLNSPRSIMYLGLRKYIATRGIDRLKIPWGWKDPRNTFTLPFWTRLFPELKVIYIERHGVDVANSLRVRSQKGMEIIGKTYLKYRMLTIIHPKRGGFLESPRCASIDGGFSLWREYVDQAEQVLGTLSLHRVLKLRYEQLLLNPIQHLLECADFCGLDISREKVEPITDTINADRAFSYKKSEKLIEFANDNQLELKERGYDC